MQQNAPTFQKSLLEQRKNLVAIDSWPEVMKLYDAGKFKECLLALIEYINAEQFEKYGNKDKSHFELRHGSIKVMIDIDDNGYKVHAPFLRVTGDKVIPFLRQVTELNFNGLTLPQIVLKDEVLSFEYEGAIDGAFPYKLYDLFKDICHRADSNDDFFIDKFGVEQADPAEHTPFDSKMVDKAYDQFMAYLKEGMEYANDFEGRRLFAFAKEVLLLQLQKIDYFMRPQGYVKGEIEMIIKKLKAKNPPDKNVADAKPKIQKLMEIDRERFAASCYEVDVFVPEGAKLNEMGVKNYFKKTIEDAKMDLEKSSFTGAYNILAGDIVSLFFYNDLPPKMFTQLEKMMVASSGKPWKEAAEGLFDGVSKLMK